MFFSVVTVGIHHYDDVFKHLYGVSSCSSSYSIPGMEVKLSPAPAPAPALPHLGMYMCLSSEVHMINYKPFFRLVKERN